VLVGHCWMKCYVFLKCSWNLVVKNGRRIDKSGIKVDKVLILLNGPEGYYGLSVN
jgi:hypothetical protein